MRPPPSEFVHCSYSTQDESGPFLSVETVFCARRVLLGPKTRHVLCAQHRPDHRQSCLRLTQTCRSRRSPISLDCSARRHAYLRRSLSHALGQSSTGPRVHSPPRQERSSGTLSPLVSFYQGRSAHFVFACFHGLDSHSPVTCRGGCSEVYIEMVKVWEIGGGSGED